MAKQTKNKESKYKMKPVFELSAQDNKQVRGYLLLLGIDCQNCRLTCTKSNKRKSVSLLIMFGFMSANLLLLQFYNIFPFSCNTFYSHIYILCGRFSSTHQIINFQTI